jgi:hypothetical protein
MRHRNIFVATLGFFLACGGLSSRAETPPPDPIRGITNFLSNLLQPHGTEFRRLAADQKYEQAAELWAREQQFFQERAGDFKDAVGSVAAGLNARLEATISEPAARLKVTIDSPSEWRSAAADRKTLQDALASYEQSAAAQDRSRSISSRLGRKKDVG